MAKKKGQAETFVLDCSVAIAWCFHDEADPYADAIALRFPIITAVVPAIWPLEIANAFLMGERRKRSSQVDTSNWFSSLNSLPITVEDQNTSRVWREVMTLARTHRLSVYDGAYLELALRRGLPLASLDEPLKAAAKAVGVPEYKP